MGDEVIVKVDGWGRLEVTAPAELAYEEVSLEVNRQLRGYGWSFGHRGLMNVGTTNGRTRYREVD